MRSARGTAVLLSAGIAAALALSVTDVAPPAAPPAAGTTDSQITLIGDGSTADTGPQPGRPPVTRLKPGERPPQFVVLSADVRSAPDIARLRQPADRNNAHLTFFLDGLATLPADKRTLYQPPRPTTVDLPSEAQIGATLAELGRAWTDGDEIATAFNSPGCHASWTLDDWQSEIDQAYSFLANWKTNTGLTDLAPLPFDYQGELAGGHPACPDGTPDRLAAEQQYPWHYDAGVPAATTAWPTRTGPLWLLPTGQSPADFPRTYQGDRAPLFLTGAPAVEQALPTLCHQPDVRCVSYRDLTDWLDAQDPQLLTRLRQAG